jgi:hypothetical protein
MYLGVINKPVVNGIKSQLQAIGNAQLVKDIMQVIFDGLLGNEELFADFLVAEALRHQLHNFFFAVAEKRLFAARTGL